MADIKISLNNIRNVKNVLIEPFGDFKVRKLGAGEELDLSEKLRRLNNIVSELNKLSRDNAALATVDVPTPEQIEELEAMQKKSDKLSREVNDIRRFELATYSRCFDDGEDGKRTKDLMDTMSSDERTEVFKAIFNPTVLPELADNFDTPSEDEEHS